MTTRSVTSQGAARVLPDSLESGLEQPEGFPSADKSGHEIKPQKIIAGFLSPGCEHDWVELADDLQTLASEGKTIWRCNTCTEITNTYHWQTP